MKLQDSVSKKSHTKKYLESGAKTGGAGERVAAVVIDWWRSGRGLKRVKVSKPFVKTQCLFLIYIYVCFPFYVILDKIRSFMLSIHFELIVAV